VGIFARSVADAAMLGCCLSGFDEGDGAGLDSPQAICQPQAGIPPLDKPLKLALVRTPVWHLASPEQQENLLNIAEKLRAAGAAVDEVALPQEFDAAHQLHRTIMFGEGARTLHALQQEHRAQLSDRLNALIDEGLAISDETLCHALGERLQVSRALHPILREYDALITPPAAGEAPATLEHTGDPAFCTIWTLTGVPAISIPSGFGPNGLPLGMQIIGPYLKDDKLVAVAQWCEQQIGLGPLIAPLGTEQ
jgi:Asp-tRNA(Asn)/Glu-tRNA(Gln) amidotransferase A subunit family amidase